MRPYDVSMTLKIHFIICHNTKIYYKEAGTEGEHIGSVKWIGLIFVL
jgi:hypothetical protein